jgi:hypothetical protein
MNLPGEQVAAGIHALPADLCRRLLRFYRKLWLRMTADLNIAVAKLLASEALEESQRHAYLNTLVAHYETAMSREKNVAMAVAAVHGLHLFEADSGPLSPAQREAVLKVVCSDPFKNVGKPAERREIRAHLGIAHIVPVGSRKGLALIAAANPDGVERIVEMSDAGYSDERIVEVLERSIVTPLAEGAL